MNEKFSIQEDQYEFPYHYLVEFEPYSTYKSLQWGCEYYSYINETINEISKINFSTLLDVGCGDGKLINELSKKFTNKKFKGIDLSEPSIYLAKGLNFNLKNSEFELKDIKNEKSKYDIVVLNEVLEHIPNNMYGKFCKNVEKRVQEKGFLIITVPTKKTPVQKKHYRHYNMEMIKKTFPELQVKQTKYLFKENIFSKIMKEVSHRRLIPKKLEKKIVGRFLKNANKNNGKHLLVVMKKQRKS